MQNEQNRPADNAAAPGVLGDPAALRKQRKERGPRNRRWLTLALLAAVTGLSVCGVLLANRVPEPEPTAAASPAASEIYRLVDAATAELTAITVTHGDGGYTLLPGDDGYVLRDAPDFTVDQSKARSLASSCAVIQYDGVIEAPDDLSAYGLDAPAATVHIAFADNTARTFLLGDKAPSGSRYYVAEQGTPDVYLVYSSVGTAWSRARGDLHVTTLPQIEVGDVRQVSLTHADGTTITIGYEAERESLGVSTLWLTSPVEYEADADKAEEYFTNIAAITLKGFADDADDANAETLSQYGLDKPRYHLVVYGQDEAGERAVIRELCIGNDSDDETVYARIDDTNDVYLLSRTSVSFLSTITVARLIDRFANIINIAKVDRVDVTADGVSETLAIERAPALDESGNPKSDANGTSVMHETFTLNGEPVADSTFRKLYQLIIGTRVDGMLPDGWAPIDGAKAALTVTYRLAEREEDEVIEYLPYNADHYAVRRNGVCLFYILKSRVDSIPEALAAYHAGTFDPKAFGL